MSDAERLNMFIDAVLEHLDRNTEHRVALLLAVTIDPETGVWINEDISIPDDLRREILDKVKQGPDADDEADEPKRHLQ